MTAKLNRMYEEFAELWPLFSNRDDYAEEAGYWRDALHAELGPGRHRVLELGIGGGHNASHLKADFDIAGADLSEGMLDHCRRLNPEIDLHVGDMRHLRLDQCFGAVLVHDAISYMCSEEDLLQTFATASAHLNPGGVLILAPDHFRETFHPPQVTHSISSDGQTELTLIEYLCDLDPSDTTMEVVMFCLINRDGELQVEEDRHVLGLFSRETWLRLLRQAGFETSTRPYLPTEGIEEPCLLIGRWPG